MPKVAIENVQVAMAPTMSCYAVGRVVVMAIVKVKVIGSPIDTSIATTSNY